MDYFDFNVPIPELDQTSAVAYSGHVIEGSSGDSRQDRTPVSDVRYIPCVLYHKDIAGWHTWGASRPIRQHPSYHLYSIPA